MIEIFKVKSGLSSELMNDVFDFIEKPYSLCISGQGRSVQQIWHRNTLLPWPQIMKAYSK